MKRKAVLIGNLDAAGAIVDVNNWKKYLRSGVGGAWQDAEIEVLLNPSLIHLENRIQNIKLNNYDFVLVAFAGHGNWKRSTILYINSRDEYIMESDIQNLALRQIICLDCCRGMAQVQDSLKEVCQKSYSLNDLNSIRQKYDQRMMQAMPQQVTLYACSIGESSYCTGSGGGYYTKNLLNVCSQFSNDDILTVNQAHSSSSYMTTAEVELKEGQKQNPDISSVRCPSFQQLIIAVSPQSSAWTNKMIY